MNKICWVCGLNIADVNCVCCHACNESNVSSGAPCVCSGEVKSDDN